MPIVVGCSVDDLCPIGILPCCTEDSLSWPVDLSNVLWPVDSSTVPWPVDSSVGWHPVRSGPVRSGSVDLVGDFCPVRSLPVDNGPVSLSGDCCSGPPGPVEHNWPVDLSTNSPLVDSSKDRWPVNLSGEEWDRIFQSEKPDPDWGVPHWLPLPLALGLSGWSVWRGTISSEDDMPPGLIVWSERSSTPNISAGADFFFGLTGLAENANCSFSFVFFFPILALWERLCSNFNHVLRGQEQQISQVFCLEQQEQLAHAGWLSHKALKCPQKPFVCDIKALRRNPGRKLNKQSKYEFITQKKLIAIHSKRNGGRNRKHLSTSEKRTNSTIKNNPRRNGQSPFSRKKYV